MKTDTPLFQTRTQTPLGAVTVAASARGLVGLWFDDQKHRPDTRAWEQADDHAVLGQAVGQLHAYFAGQRRHFELPLDWRWGTAFQQTVWQALQGIAYGGVASYGALSAQIGKARAVRAVGAAIGRNPLSIIVPCHRVLGADGSLTGYAGGLARKRALLDLEKACV